VTGAAAARGGGGDLQIDLPMIHSPDAMQRME